MQELKEVAQRLFDLAYPFTEEQLKERFRVVVRRAHPDGGGSSELFIEVRAAYSKLLGIATDHDQYTHTVEGIPLSELGLGLGALINGTDCAHCHTKGYTTTYETETRECMVCDENGISLREIRCRECENGVFRQRNGRNVLCRSCKGKGVLHIRRVYTKDVYGILFSPWKCKECRGTKRVQVSDKKRPMHSRCSKCAGTGEIRIWNPVLPKARLAGKRL